MPCALSQGGAHGSVPLPPLGGRCTEYQEKVLSLEKCSLSGCAPLRLKSLWTDCPSTTEEISGRIFPST